MVDKEIISIFNMCGIKEASFSVRTFRFDTVFENNQRVFKDLIEFTKIMNVKYNYTWFKLRRLK